MGGRHQMAHAAAEGLKRSWHWLGRAADALGRFRFAFWIIGGLLAGLTILLRKLGPWWLATLLTGCVFLIAGTVDWLRSRRRHHPAGPRITAGEISEFWRLARGSHGSDADLQVVYVRLKNTGSSVAKDAEVWMEAFDESGCRVGTSKGNWLDLSAGKPLANQPVVRTRTLNPTREEHGLEIAGKFLWSDDAYLAGESDPPSLVPGTYTIRQSLFHGERVPDMPVFEWILINEGANKPLVVSRIQHDGSQAGFRVRPRPGPPAT